MSKDNYILLDLDGVMITTPPWEMGEPLHDGFVDFNTECINQLNYIISKTNPIIVLISSHRVNFERVKWDFIFKRRGVEGFKKLELLPCDTDSKLTDVERWVSNNTNSNYVIIDDDKRFNGLSDDIKKRVVSTAFSLGLTRMDSIKALDILSFQDKEYKFLRHLVDVVWSEAKENEEVPSTYYADKIIQKAKETFENGK